MVTRKERRIIRPVTAGDSAVNGLFGGFAAGLAMTAVLIALGLLRGEAPDLLLTRFTGEETVSPWVGLLRHLAVSAIYGLVFGLLVHRVLYHWSSRLPGVLVGAAYGALLFALAELVILPGSGSPLAGIPTLEFAIAHLVYGLVLSAVILNQ